jgi:DNA-binding GntR family transcriptional regulator
MAAPRSTTRAGRDKPAGRGGREHGADNVYARLKHDISIGEIAQGTRLVETRLAERYGVSRTPIRQALLTLEQDGLVARNGRSLHVRGQSPTEIMELYDLREMLEERAARLAARRHDESDTIVLRRLLERMSGELTKLERYTLNREFHASIWRAAHHHALLQTLERLYANSVLGLTTTLASPERWTQTLAEHRDMVEAILNGDEERAAALVQTHLRTARDIRIEASLDRTEDM